MLSPIGIDFGDQYCIIGIYRNNGVDILSNQSSNRITPSMVTYSNFRRYAGEESQQRKIENSSTTFIHLKRLLALPYTSSQCEQLKDSIPFELVEIPGGYTGIKIQYQDRIMSLYPEQCVGFFLKNITYNIVRPITDLNNYIISVPQCWSEIQRRSLLLSAKIGGINVFSLLNSNTAAAICYHHRRGHQSFSETKPEHIFLIDVGNSAMNVSVSRMKRNSIEMLSCGYDTELGGSSLNDPLIQYLLDVVKSKYNIDPRQQKRSFLRFLDAAEKTKKNLSVNKVVQFEVHSIMGVDILFPVERDTFHNLIKNKISRIPKLIDACLKSSSVTKNMISQILVLGGGSRVVAIKEVIEAHFHKKLSSLLDLEESFAIGCALFGNLFENNPKEKPFIIKDILPYDITAVWTEYGKEKKVVLFRKFSPLKSKKIFDVKVSGGSLSISVFSKNLPIGLVDITTEKSVFSRTVSLTAKIDRNGILSFSHSKECSLFNYTPMNYTTPQTIDGFFQVEREMWENDQLQTQIDVIKNDLESLIFKMENDLERDLVEFFTPVELVNAKSILEKSKNWFEAHENVRLPIDDYKEQIRILKEATFEQEKRKEKI